MPFDLDDDEYRATRILTGADKPDKIQVGEYVRTRNGEIGIFKGYNANKKSQWKLRIEFQRVKTWKYCAEEYIVKHKPKLIDLIEVGDYVNGELIVDKLQTPCRIGKEGKKFVFTKNMNIGEGYFEEDIKSIVTKEQFASMEYKIGG